MNHAYSRGKRRRLISSPQYHGVVVPARQAYSHSASVGSRYVRPAATSSGRADNWRQNSAASSHVAESTGYRLVSCPATLAILSLSLFLAVGRERARVKTHDFLEFLLGDLIDSQEERLGNDNPVLRHFRIEFCQVFRHPFDHLLVLLRRYARIIQDPFDSCLLLRRFLFPSLP